MIIHTTRARAHAQYLHVHTNTNTYTYAHTHISIHTHTHPYIYKHRDEASGELLAFLLERACGPIFEMLEQWIYKGVCLYAL